MGLVVTGFTSSPLGEIYQYTPTLKELGVSVGIYALGAFVFTILAKGGIAIELGYVGQRKKHSVELDDHALVEGSV